MCEPSTPLTVLRNISFAVSAIAESSGERGSYERELARCAAKGIRRDLDWVIAQLEASDEGNKNIASVSEKFR